jgi:hypothetical protein
MKCFASAEINANLEELQTSQMYSNNAEIAAADYTTPLMVN